ncbi:MAG TPA: FtsX-like permease family protein [Steroidobacteraceae bacterium]|nr:FtsX-like permease family protein [Steroidobacteraceae bacterium]
MIIHFLQTALRHFQRHKYATIANTLCLAFGMTCFLIAYSFYAFFASAESGFSNSDRIYIVKTWPLRNNEKDLPFAGAPYFVAKQIKDAFPEFKDVSLASNLLGGVMPKKLTFADRHYEDAHIMAADDAFFRLFDIPFLSGNRSDALSTPDGVVISKLIATKLFGNQDAVGKVIQFENGAVATVTGVTGSLPEPSHLTMSASRDAADKPYLDVLVSWALYKKMATRDVVVEGSPPPADYDPLDGNVFPNVSVYIRGIESSSIHNLNSRLQSLFDAAIKGKDFTYNGDKITYKASFVPVQQSLEIFAESAAKLLGMPLTSLLNIFGTLILAVAVLNYINLYTTQVITTRKEMGTNQLLGATKLQIVLQSMLETFLVCIVALALALLLFHPLKGFISTVSFVKFNITWLTGWRFVLSMFMLTVLLSLAASLYPVMIISRTSPLDSLRIPASGVSQRRLTQALVAIQFAVAGVLVFLIVVTYQQKSELRRLALNNMTDPVVLLQGNLFANGIDYHTFVNEMSGHSSIKGVALADNALWGTSFSLEPNTVSKPNSSTRIRADVRYVSSNYFNVMRIKMLAGSDFLSSRDEILIKQEPQNTVVENAGRNDKSNYVVVDKNFIVLLGYKSASELIGKSLVGRGNIPEKLIISGVVDNAYQGINGTHNEGTVFVQGIRNGTPVIQVDKEHVDEALRDIDSTMKALAPAKPMKPIFLDEYYALNGVGVFNLLFIMMTFLMVLAIAISIMGMVGMATHTIARRTREISIRKSLGASTLDIMMLLMKYFAMPVLAANVLIGWPLGWLASRAFLSLFPYRTAINGTPFVISLLAVLFISCGAVYFQTYRAARHNPAHILRYE